MIRKVLYTAFVAGLMLSGISNAQPSRIPTAGTSLPSVSILDETGESFSTDQLRGQYTVLVFGCLT
ncbi:MAG: hypothetical protein O2856_04675 [Planctomycetota bacterium]|nr:hypothetical protein [Planctomycetota bacterium]